MMSVWANNLNGSLWKSDVSRKRIRRIALNAGRFFLGVALGNARLFSSCGPFGIAAVAAAGAETRGLIYLGSVTVGYLLSGGVTVGTRYIATALLVFTVGFVVRNTELWRKRWFMPAVAVFMTAATEALYLLGDAISPTMLVRAFTEVITAGGCGYLFGFVTEPEEIHTESADVRKGIGAAVLFTCATMGAARLILFSGISAGRILGMLGIMTGAFCGGGIAGCAIGVAVGLGMDMAGSAGLFYAAAYGIAGSVGGFFSRYGKPAFCSAFCAANAMAVLFGWEDGERMFSLYEGIIAGGMFMLLPQRLLIPVGGLFRVGRGKGETAFRLYQAERLEKLSEGFRMLCTHDGENSVSVPADKAMSAVFDRAADAVCGKCEEKERCWKQEAQQTVSMLDGIAENLAAGGVLRVEDMPAEFRENCLAPEAFVGAVNGELRGMSYRQRYESRLKELRVAASGQFLDMSEVMKTAAGEMQGNAGPDTGAERRVMRFLKSGDADGACSAFRDGRGRLHVVIESEYPECLDGNGNLLESLSDVLGISLCREPCGQRGRMVFRQAEPLAASVGIASVKKEGEDISGDWGTYFKTDSGILCVVLSDGMGTGRQAAKESSSSVDILRRLLEAGVEPGCAMRLLNAAALLRNGEDWGYATVDLCCIDLFTGETCFYKYGAAPSYVRTGRGIRRVKCTSLAAGMIAGESSAPDVVRMHLKPGNVALIASDGVLAERKDQWLRDVLSHSDDMEPKELAREALRAASEKFGVMDDMTALTVRLERRQ